MDWLERLNNLKNISKKTNEEISILSGIPKSTVDKIFSGHTKNPAYPTIEAIVNSLGYSVDALSPPLTKDINITGESGISDKAKKIAKLYEKANDVDKKIVDLTLEKYKV